MALNVAPPERPARLAVPEDVVHRRAYALDQIPVEDNALAQAHALWSRRRSYGLLPARHDIDLTQIRLLVQALHLVDTGALLAEDYLCRFDAALSVPDPPAAIEDLRLGDVKPAAYRQSVMEDYRTVVLTGVPAFHLVAGRIDGAHHDYSRLILPLADDGRRVTALIVCTNSRIFEDFSI